LISKNVLKQAIIEQARHVAIMGTCRV